MNALEKMSLILKASEDPAFFNSHEYFCGYSLYPKLEEIMAEFYTYDRHGTPLYNELDMICGKKSGKTTLASRICCYETFDLLIRPDPAAHYGLEPGTEIFIIGLAKSEEQAHDTIFSKIRTVIKRSPFFRSFNPKFYSLEIRFPTKNVNILCGCSSSGSMTGRLVKAICFDEISQFDETQSQRGAWQVYSLLSKDTHPFGFHGKRIVTTSPRHVNDIGMQLLDRAKTHPRMLWVHEPTWKLNPTSIYAYDSPEMKAERDKDPLTFWRDFGAEPWSSLETYYREPDIITFEEDIQNVLRLFFEENILLPPSSNTYVFTGDPAKKYDAFGMCLAHIEFTGKATEGEPNGTIVADGLYRLKPTKKRELDPIFVKDKILKVIKTFLVRYAIFDTWNYPEAQEAIRRLGVPVMNHVVRKEDHDSVKRRLYFKKLKLCPYPILGDELKNLQVINAKKVDHPKGGHKDVADTLANAVWALENALPKRPFAFNIVQTF